MEGEHFSALSVTVPMYINELALYSVISKIWAKSERGWTATVILMCAT